MPVKAPPMAAPVMYNWTGFYIGWPYRRGPGPTDNGNHRISIGDTTVFRASGRGLYCFEDHGTGAMTATFIAGGQVGFNYQIGQWVWGVEGQIIRGMTSSE